MVVFGSPSLALASLGTPRKWTMKSFAKAQAHTRRSKRNRVLRVSLWREKQEDYRNQP
jgi:hypothetical protein